MTLGPPQGSLRSPLFWHSRAEGCPWEGPTWPKSLFPKCALCPGPVGHNLCTGAEHGLGRPQGRSRAVNQASRRMALFMGEKEPCSRGNPQSSELEGA